MARRVKFGAALLEDSLLSLRLLSEATGIDIGTIIETALRPVLDANAATIEAARNAQRPGIVLPGQVASLPAGKPLAKPSRKPSAKASAKPSDFDARFWALLDEKGMGTPTLSKLLTEAGHKVTPEGIRYWKKGKRGIPADMVAPLSVVLPELVEA